jgi:hypothetical protein
MASIADILSALKKGVNRLSEDSFAKMIAFPKSDRNPTHEL